MKNAVINVLFAALAAATAWKWKPEKEPLPSAPPVISVQEMGTLATLRVNHANVIEFNESLAQDIPWTNRELRFGRTRVLLVTRGECILGTDLLLAKYEQVVPGAKTASLSLPSPKVISARLNHDPKNGSYLYDVSNNGLASVLPGTDRQTKATNHALQKGQAEIEAACAKPDLALAARKSAETVLQPVVSATGWKVTIVWR